MSTHLWEPEHDYYGPEGCYWATSAQQGGFINRYSSWDEYVATDGMFGAIAGLNMLYRWDWHAWHLEYPNDYPNGSESHELELFWMMPRKGIMARDTIAVTPADEPAVRTWLEPHWRYVRDLWEPLSTTSTERAS